MNPPAHNGAAMSSSPPSSSSRSVWTAPLRPLGRVGGSLLDRVLCVLGAVGLSQAPEFFQQYLQRLGGHLDEARLVMRRYEVVAQESGITVRELIDTTRAQTAQPVARLGDVIAESQARLDALTVAETALREANLWERPFVFLRHVDWDIAGRAWEVFKPAVPVTVEGLVYAGVGMVLALVLYQGCVAVPCRALARRFGRPNWSAPDTAKAAEMPLALPKKETRSATDKEAKS